MKNASTYILAVVAVSLLASVAISCEPEQRTTLTSAEKKLVDSLYSRDISYVRKLADADCDANYDEYFKFYADSVKAAYLADIKDIEAYLRNQGYE